VAYLLLSLFPLSFFVFLDCKSKRTILQTNKRPNPGKQSLANSPWNSFNHAYNPIFIDRVIKGDLAET
jgi:hypothetical protein